MSWQSQAKVSLICVGSRRMRRQEVRLASGRMVLVISAILLPFLARAAENASVEIDAVRTSLEKWVEIQRIISLEKRDLALAKEMLNERIELVQREIDTLRDRISDAEKSVAETDRKRSDLMVENNRLKISSASLTATLASLENRTRQLLGRLPEPIRERVKPLSQRLPEPSSETRLSISERYQNVVGILNEVNKFNREITITSEVRTLPDGTSAEVTALYLGIGQAFYSGANGKIAGIGTVMDQGWDWKPANESAAEIAQIIAILNNERVASFVQVPVEIR